MSEDLQYYLLERLGETIGGAGIPAVLYVELAMAISRRPATCLKAGLLGSMFQPAVHFIMLQSSTQQHHVPSAPDEIVLILFGLMVGAVAGLLGYAGKKRYAAQSQT